MASIKNASSNKRRKTGEEKNVVSKAFTPRDYQIQIFESARERNTIACIGPGNGKILIAVMLIREEASSIRKPFADGGKRVFFLVPSVPHVAQITRTIKEHTDFHVKGIGGMGIHQFNKELWMKEFSENEVLVMTGEIFLILVDHNFIRSSQIQLLIVDECHKAVGNHCYRLAMKRLADETVANRPKLFGMSSSLVDVNLLPSMLEEKLKEIETTLHATILTTNIAKQYETEITIEYPRHSLTPTLLQETKALVHSLKSKYKEEDFSIHKGDSIVFFEKPSSCLISLGKILENLGPSAASKAAEVYIEEIERLRSKTNTKILEETCTFLVYFDSVCLTIASEIRPFCPGQMETKLEKLVNIFLESRLNQERSDHCSLILVDHNITAYVLHQWLLDLQQNIPDLNFLNPAYLFCHPKNNLPYEMQHKNVLIVTPEIEGFYIPQCEIVIIFDIPSKFSIYNQSKERAKMNSTIFTFVQKGHQSEKNLSNFQTVEKILLQSEYRTKPNEEEIRDHFKNDEMDAYMPYGPTGPRITMNSAVHLIKSFCRSLHSDTYAVLNPQWNIKKADEKGKTVICELSLPINSHLREKIVGEPMATSGLAKMSAALIACKFLHEKGEMNENLLPISFLQNRELEPRNLEEVRRNQPKADIQRLRIYPKGVASVLKDAIPEANTPCYMNVLELKLVIPLPSSLNPKKRPIIDPQNTPRGLALLSKAKLPQVNPFRIFTECGKILVTINPSNCPLTLKKDDILEIEEFHRFVFSDTLWIEGEKVFDPHYSPSSYFVIPVNKGNDDKYDVDWAFMRETRQHPFHTQKKQSSKIFDRTPFDEKVFSNAVLMRPYKKLFWKVDRPTFHYVVDIVHDKSPMSLLEGDNKCESYADYYINKYGLKILNENQPLICTIQYSNLNMWKLRKEDYKKLTKCKEVQKYLVPELSLIHPFPKPFFFKVSCLPTILFRLNCLLLAEEIRGMVAREAFVGMPEFNDNFRWPEFCPETSDKDLMEHLYITGEIKEENLNNMKLVPQDIIKDINGKITSFDVKCNLKNHSGPSPCLLFQALTAKSTRDEFNTDRFEVIGNSFLKYVTSVMSYINYLDYDEGELSIYRTSIIQNINIYQKAKEKKIGAYLTTTSFNSTMNWLPPCYCYVQEDAIEEKYMKHSEQIKADEVYFTKQIISDKSVAACLKAMIGAYLLACGQEGAVRFLSWCGLIPVLKTVPSEIDCFQWPPSPPVPIVNQQWLQQLDYHTGGFDSFEENLNYQFKNKSYLLEAVTHPSYYHNTITNSFQRLEYIGDVVIDYIITRVIYDNQNSYSSNQIVNCRTELVNNVFFATLAVYYKFDTLLKSSPDISNAVKTFKSGINCNEDLKDLMKKHFEKRDPNIKVPKILGDLFEAIVGAIFVDSDLSLGTVWEVCRPMMQPAFNYLKMI